MGISRRPGTVPGPVSPGGTIRSGHSGQNAAIMSPPFLSRRSRDGRYRPRPETSPPPAM